MIIKYGCELSIVVDRPTPTCCLVDIHADRRGDIVSETCLAARPSVPLSDESDLFGNRLRRFVAEAGESTLCLSGVIRDSGMPDARDHAAPVRSVSDLPSEVLTYLNGSRYCETDKMGEVAWKVFGHLPRDAGLVQSVCDFVHERIRFDYKLARSTRTAVEAYEERVGVCRDFTHLAITLCRCLNIPARYVNGYLGDIGVPPDPSPMDFNAWFEVYLGDGWYTYDARHNQRRIGRLPIARGRDACDVPMLQTFGPHVLKTFKIVTEEVADPDRAAAA
jgi:transglutaminase-like putative cysteine protease